MTDRERWEMQMIRNDIATLLQLVREIREELRRERELRKDDGK